MSWDSCCAQTVLDHQEPQIVLNRVEGVHAYGEALKRKKRASKRAPAGFVRQQPEWLATTTRLQAQQDIRRDYNDAWRQFA